jgi:hypothetical protein
LISAILLGAGFYGLQKRTERGREDNAKARLSLVLTAEKRYYAYIGKYTDDWELLSMKDPSAEDPYYEYSITDLGSGYDFKLRAKREGSSFVIVMDKHGNVTTLGGR